MTPDEIRELRYNVATALTRNTYGPQDTIVQVYLEKAVKQLDKALEYKGKHTK